MNEFEKLFAAFAAMSVIAGCAIVDDKAAVDPKTGKGEVYPPEMGVSEQGVITVATLFPTSDVAVIPSSISHVVWRRPAAVLLQREEPKRQRADEQVSRTARDKRRVVDNWPLLEEDMNFDSEIGRVDMCRADNSGCMEPNCAIDLVPCENPEDHQCFTMKQGEYCIEEGVNQ